MYVLTLTNLTGLYYDGKMIPVQYSRQCTKSSGSIQLGKRKTGQLNEQWTNMQYYVYIRTACIHVDRYKFDMSLNCKIIIIANIHIPFQTDCIEL